MSRGDEQAFPIDRLVSKFSINTVSGCWTWHGTSNPDGYGIVYLKGRRRTMAHRVSYELYRNRIGDGLQLDHLCRNPSCVNPWHLEEVTSRENTLRGNGPSAKEARATHCLRGHEFSQHNTHVRRDGSRLCMECNNIRSRRYRADALLAELAKEKP